MAAPSRVRRGGDEELPEDVPTGRMAAVSITGVVSASNMGWAA
jgi:hypothetical protein